MAFPENGSITAKPTDAKRGMLETVKGWFVREKPQTGPDRLDLLRTNLLDSKKQSLARFIRAEQKMAVENKTPDLGAYAASLFAEEIAVGIVDIEELHVLAETFTKHRISSPKNPDSAYKNSLAKEISSELRFRAKTKIDFKRASGKPVSDDEEEVIIKAIKDKVSGLVEKIIAAPKKLTSNMGAFAEQLETDVAINHENFLTAPHGDLTQAELEKILIAHPDDYATIVSGYELASAQAARAETSGMDVCIKALRDASVSFSPVDGTILKTPADRVAYAERLANAGEVRAKWYETKPPTYDKTFAREFTSTEVIPRAIATNAPLDELAKELHWYQTAGSPEQIERVKVLEKDLAGNYRQEFVFVGNERVGWGCPQHTVVPELMTKLAAQAEYFSVELEARRDSLSPADFEKQVLQYACLILNRFGAIHPMADGNGRTARSLYEYTIAKHLGSEKMAEYSTRHFGPAETIPNDLKLDQVYMNHKDQMDFGQNSSLYKTLIAKDPDVFQRIGLQHAPLLAHLETMDFDQEVVNDQELIMFTNKFREALMATKKQRT